MEGEANEREISWGPVAVIQVEGKEALHSGMGNGDGEEKMNLRAMSMALGLIEYSE